MLVKGKLQSEGSKTSLIANVDGRIFKSWLVDQEGTLHLFTKVNYLSYLISHISYLMGR